MVKLQRGTNKYPSARPGLWYQLQQGAFGYVRLIQPSPVGLRPSDLTTTYVRAEMQHIELHRSDLTTSTKPNHRALKINPE